MGYDQTDASILVWLMVRPVPVTMRISLHKRLDLSGQPLCVGEGQRIGLCGDQHWGGMEDSTWRIPGSDHAS